MPTLEGNVRMKKKKDLLYQALYLIDINFNWRWINHAELIDKLSNYKTNYSKNPKGFKKLFKQLVLKKVIRIGYPSTFELTDEDIHYFFLRHTRSVTDLVEIHKYIGNRYKKAFLLDKDQIIDIIELVFMLPNHIVKLAYPSLLELKAKIQHGKQRDKKYRAMAYVKKTLENFKKTKFSDAYNFMDIPPSTWYSWRKTIVDGKPNIKKFQEWKTQTPLIIQENLASEVSKYIIDSAYNVTKIKKVIPGFSELVQLEKNITGKSPV